MARYNPARDASEVYEAARAWVARCFLSDGSILSGETQLWTRENVEELVTAFIENPDESDASFIDKLDGQLGAASPAAKKLMAEMLWVLLLFQRPMSPQKKRETIAHVWGLSGEKLQTANPVMSDEVLLGLGNPGTAYNTKRWRELSYLISLTRIFKQLTPAERVNVIADPWRFAETIASVPQVGQRQFRHIIKHLIFPDAFERIATSRDKRAILAAFEGLSELKLKSCPDVDIDRGLLALRKRFEVEQGTPFDFYQPQTLATWKHRDVVKTLTGEVAVEIPEEESKTGTGPVTSHDPISDDSTVRDSFRMQGLVAKIGAEMGFRIWVPRSDRTAVHSQVPGELHGAFLESLSLNYDDITLRTIEQIDVIWLSGRAMARAFEIEHTTAIYSGLLRMADLLALQPNMSIRLHIVAPAQKRDKVMREIKRPTFSLLEHGPLYEKCTFISYEALLSLSNTPHLSHVSDSIIEEFEETPDDD